MPASSQLLSRLRANVTTQGTILGKGTVPQAMVAPSLTPPSLVDSMEVLEEALTEVEAEAYRAAQASVAVPALDSLSAEPTPPTPPQLSPLPPTPLTPELPTVMASAVPLAVAQATDTLNPAVATPTYKESALSSVATEAAPAQGIDLGGGYQLVEVEKSSELPVEVQGYLQEVEDNVDQQPQEIVIADGSIQLQPSPLTLTKVVVLPITPEVEAVGQRKSPNFSLRWLVEWSRRLMKMFSGKIIYKQTT